MSIVLVRFARRLWQVSYRLTTSRLCSFAFSGTAAAAADAAADAAESYICKRVEGKKNENWENWENGENGEKGETL